MGSPNPNPGLSLIFSVLLTGVVVTSSDNLTPRGVPLSRAALYDPQKDFSCLDGSKLIPFSMVNDDYCDCSDGSDEPGTSACSRGSFYCQNAGHMAEYIPSSRVNDHICDCCDGSDESITQCPNTCDEMGRAAREESERLAKLLKEGYQKRLEMSNSGKDFRKSKDEEKVKLDAERQKLEAIKQEKEKVKEEVEVPEKEALDRYRQIEEEKQKKLQEEEQSKTAAEAENMFNMLDSNSDGKLTMEEIKARQTFDKDKNGEVSDEEAMFFLNMDTEMSKDDFLTTGWLTAKPFFLMEQGMFQPPSEDNQEGDQDPSLLTGGASSTEEPEPEPKELTDEEIQGREEKADKPDLPGVEEEEEIYDDEKEEDGHDEAPEIPEAESKYDEATQQLIDVAEKARSEFNEADRNVREIVRQLEELNEVLNTDFGEDERFSPLLGQCFDFEDREYIYTLCPFKTATQKGRSGGGEVSIGKWGSWNGPEGDKYASMMYDRGQSCWNGPNRSAKVVLSCGTENRLTAVSEPSRCEYQYEFTSPAACDKPQHGHDEL